MSAIDDILRHNAAVEPPEPGLSSKAPPRKRLAIVACMDARIVPERHLGIRPGDVHLIRNAGGRIAEAIRSLALSQEVLGTQEVMLIHHTACGLMADSDAGVKARFEARGIDVSDVDFLTFTDLEASLAEDVATYRASPLLRQDIPLRTFVFDVATSRLREVAVNA
jgi:carbonic anhydrase